MTKRSAENYEKKNPTKARIIKRAIKRGVKEYAGTFRRLASV